MVGQRLFPEAVPREEKTLLPRIPNGEGEHAPEQRQHFYAVFLVKMNQGFGIAVRSEPVATPGQFFPEFDVIVNLAVKNDVNSLILIRDRLMAAGQVHDTETADCQACAGSFEEP